MKNEQTGQNLGKNGVVTYYEASIQAHMIPCTIEIHIVVQ